MLHFDDEEMHVTPPKAAYLSYAKLVLTLIDLCFRTSHYYQEADRETNVPFIVM